MATILIVDDDVAIRELIAAVIEQESGHEVMKAENGRQALDTLSDSPVDLVVCDINMPVMNGIELVREMRADERHSALPVVMISANPSLERIDPQLDVDLMLQKPFEVSVLLGCISSALSRVRRGRGRARSIRRRASSSLARSLRVSRRQQWGCSCGALARE
jgi:DNA-binding response OmpR family regulator